MSAFLERIQASVLVADGGMGTLLHERGISFGRSFDGLCLDQPDVVRAIHCDYIEAGADVIETNSFGANGLRLKQFGLADRVAELNRAAARLARQAREEMGRDVFVAGAIGPTGRQTAQIDSRVSETMLTAFSRQVEGLLEGGIDLFILETFSDINELQLAVQAIRALSDMPIVAEMTFSDDGMTLLGLTAGDVAETLEIPDVDIIGANCSVGPQPLIDVIHGMSKVSSKPLAVMPNAGLPKYRDGRYLYYASPAYFGSCAPEFLACNVRLIGGCCGTTPDHIRHLRQAVDNPEQGALERSYQPLYDTTVEEKTERPAAQRNRFREKLGREFVVSVELDPPRGSNPQKILKGARYLADLGVDAVNIADSPMGRARMGVLAAAALVGQSTGLEVIMHLTCRDQNLMGLQSTILGAYALGIHNVLAVTGDPPRGDYPGVTAVYDVDSIGLLKVIGSLNRGIGITGAKIGYPTDIIAGVALNPSAPDVNLEIDRLKRKLDNGAAYVMTQPVFDIDALRRFLDRIAHLNATVIMGVLPLHSLRHAIYLDNEVPGISVPETVKRRIDNAGRRARREGIAIAADISARGRELVDGIYYMPSFGRYETIGRVLRQMGLTSGAK